MTKRNTVLRSGINMLEGTVPPRLDTVQMDEAMLDHDSRQFLEIPI